MHRGHDLISLQTRAPLAHVVDHNLTITPSLLELSLSFASLAFSSTLAEQVLRQQAG